MNTKRQLAALIDFAEGEAYCPCCEGVRECLPECTFKEDMEQCGGDAVSKYERMMAARRALNAGEENETECSPPS